jgi:hypothetical protein
MGMRNNLVLYLCIVAILTIPLSCKEDNDPIARKGPPLTLPEMVACHQTATWDSLTIRNKLLGLWAWEYIQCFGNPQNGNYEDFKGMTVDFKPNNTVEIRTNGQMVQTSTWTMVNLNDGYFSIQTSPLVLQLPGRIMFCAERVLFSDSYTDGCDNFFIRK